VTEARWDAERAHRLLALLDDAAPWFDAETRVSLARAELRLSDAAAARRLLTEASRALRRVPEHTTVHAWIDDAWARADTFAVSAVTGPSTLTTAELRVLRFLPSHLSFREIAARLHVSTNTVKTQAHAVYRKLDASSRSEAVAQARDVGLVDG
jgi:LuxR family maltose regulon positive regulatory protein